MEKPRPNTSAQKRVLWEVRQRYNLQPHSAPSEDGATRAKPLASPKSVPAARKHASAPPFHTGQGKPPKPPRSTPPRHPAGGGRPKRRGRFVKRTVGLLLLLALLGGGIFGYKIIAAGNKISTTDRSLLGQLSDLLFSQGKYLEGEEEGRINILLLAIGGEGHSGQNLADTIMIASIRPADHQVALLSIPRDLYVPVPGEEYYSKINAVHAYGEAQKAGEGPETLRKTAEEITGLPIHYYGRVDFTGFKQIVDAVGGVTITIDNSFFDYWHKISFSAGTEKMDGERALAYVRARYIEGPEGGDFKRAARQQQVLVSLKEKIFSLNTALDFTALSGILDSVSDNVRTDLHLWEMKRLYEIARQVDQGQFKSEVLTTGPSDVLVGTTEVLGGTPASVLKPRTGDWSEIHTIAANIFTSDKAKTIASTEPPSADRESADEPTPEPSDEPTPAPKPTLEIRNGTNITGLAKKVNDDLEGRDYDVLTIGNAARRDVAKTIVYILADEAAEGGKEVAEYLKAETDSGLPSEEAASEADVLIILGPDAQ